MGRSTTTKCAMEMDGCTGRCWHVRGSRSMGTPTEGAPTAENLTRAVESYIRSIESGGVNAHISKALGYIPYPNWARIVWNDGSRRVICEWTAPAFMAVGDSRNVPTGIQIREMAAAMERETA